MQTYAGHRRKHKGFTLVELVVVVMILGILAAVAAPRLLGTSSAAAENGLRQTLSIVRDAIERYAAENGGQLPGQGGTEASFKDDIAQYLRGPFPTCPVANQNDEVEVVASSDDPLEASPGATTGWKYSTATGAFIVNSSTAPEHIQGVTGFDEL